MVCAAKDCCENLHAPSLCMSAHLEEVASRKG